MLIAVWIGAWGEHYWLLSSRDLLAVKMHDMDEAMRFHGFVARVQDSFPDLPTCTISPFAIQTYERLRDEILLQDEVDRERQWKQDLELGAQDQTYAP